MKTKQEKIKEAYGVCWNQVKEFVDENGWCSDCQIDFNNKGYNTWLEYIHADCKEMHIVYGEPEQWYRPKSLAGIGDNNGWIKIKSKDDLPKNRIECWIMQGERMYQATLWNSKFWHSEVNKNESPITHYQPIVKPSKPIY